METVTIEKSGKVCCEQKKININYTYTHVWLNDIINVSCIFLLFYLWRKDFSIFLIFTFRIIDTQTFVMKNIDSKLRSICRSESNKKSINANSWAPFQIYW